MSKFIRKSIIRFRKKTTKILENKSIALLNLEIDDQIKILKTKS